MKKRIFSFRWAQHERNTGSSERVCLCKHMLLQMSSVLSAVALSLKMEYFKCCQIMSLPLQNLNPMLT